MSERKYVHVLIECEDESQADYIAESIATHLEIAHDQEFFPSCFISTANAEEVGDWK